MSFSMNSSSQLQRDLLDVAGGRAHDRPADLSRAGERDLVDPGVFGHVVADLGARAGDNVHHAIRGAGLHEDAAELDGGAGRELGGLRDDGAARGERGGELPRREQHREVPRRDHADDADGLTHREADGVGDVLGDRLAVHVQGDAGVVLVDVGGHRDLGDRHAERLADLLREHGGERHQVRADAVGDLAQDIVALLGGRIAPGAAVEGAAGRVDREIDVGRAREGVGADELAVGGVEPLERLAALRGQPLAVDEHLEGLGLGGGPGVGGHRVASLSMRVAIGPGGLRREPA
jgi:hypothetical protein